MFHAACWQLSRSFHLFLFRDRDIHAFSFLRIAILGGGHSHV